MKYPHMGMVKIVVYWSKPPKMNGGSQEKVPRLLLKLGARSKKEERARVVGYWAKEHVNDDLFSCENKKTSELRGKLSYRMKV
jgi:hypothetical protein